MMPTPPSLTRRTLLAATSGLALNSMVSPALAQLARTPAQAEGPFYPVDKPVDQDADLARLGPDKPLASGELILVEVRVLQPEGKPVQNALVEIWQANSFGRYQDRRDGSGQPWDKNFQGYGKVRTGADGAYAFRTIRPAGYGSGFRRRTPHIHYRVSGDGFRRFTTQMYFAGVAENGRDSLLRRVTDKDRLIVDFKPGRYLDQPIQRGVFEIVI